MKFNHGPTCSYLRSKTHCSSNSLRDEPYDTLSEIVGDYKKNHACRIESETEFFLGMEFSDAIACATLAYTNEELRKNGKKHHHQWRIPGNSLEAAKLILGQNKALLKECQTFDELHEVIKAYIGHIPKIGPVTIYDTTHRIGMHLRLQPEFVYLHAGVATGAKALGLNHKAEKLSDRELPKPLRRGHLRSEEVEDFLCIYRREIQICRNKFL